jgi:hypothetical protein
MVPSSLWVAGEFAIYSTSTSPNVLLRLFVSSTGLSADVSATAELTNNSVAADGTVAFWAGAPAHQLFRYRAGVQTALTNAPTQSHAWPLTDGENTVFRKSVPGQNAYNIALLEGTTEIALASALNYNPQPRTDYAIANGWVAFTSLSAQQQKQVHVRSPGPTGTVQQRTQFSTPSRIETLRDNGELMLINQSRRLFSDGVNLMPVSSVNGVSYVVNGAWHIAIRGTLFAVDTSD